MSLNPCFEGRRVLITGGARGIGLAIAKKFLLAKATVYILDLDEGQLNEVATANPGLRPVVANLGDWEGCRATIEGLGSFHHLVNNAGIVRPAETLLDIKPESIDTIFGINFKSIVNTTQIVAKGMIKDKLEGPTIVNMSSISDTVAVAGLGMYSCSKAAITMLTKQSALELGPEGIRVNCVRPAMTNTEHVGSLTGAGGSAGKPIFQNVKKVNSRRVIDRLVEMDEVADAVLYLSSCASRMVTGSDILLDGGIFTN